MALTFTYLSGKLVHIAVGDKPPPEYIASRPAKPQRLNNLATPCVHLRGPTGEKRDCATCGGKKGIPLYGCELHGRCTLTQHLVYRDAGRNIEVYWCRTCPDYSTEHGAPTKVDPFAEADKTLKASAKGWERMLRGVAPATPSWAKDGPTPDLDQLATKLRVAVDELQLMTADFTPAQMRELDFHATAMAGSPGDPTFDLSCTGCCAGVQRYYPSGHVVPTVVAPCCPNDPIPTILTLTITGSTPPDLDGTYTLTFNPSLVNPTWRTPADALGNVLIPGGVVFNGCNIGFGLECVPTSQTTGNWLFHVVCNAFGQGCGGAAFFSVQCSPYLIPSTAFTLDSLNACWSPTSGGSGNFTISP